MIIASALGCSQTPQAETARKNPDTESAPSSRATADSPHHSAGNSRDSEQSPANDQDAHTARSVPPEEQSDAQKEQREIIYRVTPEGLIIELDNIRFEPSVKPVKQPSGTWGVEITIVATSTGDHIYSLLSGNNGPIAVAGHVTKKGGTQVPFGDERQGTEEEFVTPGQPVELHRTWKGDGAAPPLLWGETLTLQVGLWGLGEGDAPRRSVKKMFEVSMVSGAAPKPLISPPR